MKKKQEAGADYFITQPIFDSEKVKILKEVMKTAGVTIPIFIGVIPLVSSRNAEFLHNEVPGILLTDETRERMRMAEEEGRGLEVGMTIAKELIDEICQEFNGIYLMTPFMNYEISAELCEYIQAKKQQEKSICSCGQVHSQ
ncbi:MAG: methylenetetrahydrofolate reductase [Carnobacterium sp.]